MPELTPEQRARRQIDAQLVESGWVVQDYRQFNPTAGPGIALREVPLKTGPCDYLLLVDRKAIGIIEAKKEGTTLSTVADQSGRYASNLPDFCSFVVNDSVLVNPNSQTYVYGNFACNGRIEQDGGDITVNGTNASAALSVADTKNIIFINGAGANCSAGSITVSSPHHNTMFPFVNTVEIGGNNLNGFYGTHTFNIGDGVSSTSGPTNRGITLGNGAIGGNKAPIQNMVVQSGSFTFNREFRTSITNNSGTYIKGDVTVYTGSEFQHIWSTNPDCAIGGNITVNSGAFFTSYRALTLGGIGYTTNTQQTIGGAGTFREDYVNSSYNFGNLIINNARPDTAVILNIPVVTLRDSLVMTAGSIMFQNGLELGSASNPAPVLRYTSGYIYSLLGYFRRYYSSAAGTIPLSSDASLFPWGVKAQSRMIRIGGTITGNGYLTTTLIDDFGAVPIPSAYQAIDNGVLVNSQTRLHWNIATGGSFAANNLSLQLSGVNAFLDDVNASNLRLYRSTFLPADTTITSGTTAVPIVTRAGITAETALTGTWALAGNNQQLITEIPTKQSGLYNDTATWKFNYVPNYLYGGHIKTTHTVTTSPTSNDAPQNMIVDNGATLNLVNKTGAGIFLCINKLTIDGVVNVSGAGNEVDAEDSTTTVALNSTGVLNVNSGTLNVYRSAGPINRKALLQVNGNGQLNLTGGTLNILGSLKMLNNSGFNMTAGALNFNPNYQQNPTFSSDSTIMDLQTEGSVSFTGGDITFENPPATYGVKTLSVKRTSPLNIELAKSNFFMGAQTSTYGLYSGAPGTGFIVDTKAGVTNIPIGRMIFNNATTANNRFVRNGPGGLFIKGDLGITQTMSLRLYNDGSENILDGSLFIASSGFLYTMGKLTFGGTAQFPSSRKMVIDYYSAAGALNDTLSPTANFRKLYLNSQGGARLYMSSPLTVSDELGLTNGLIYTDSVFTLGTSASNPGTLVMGNGGIVTSIFNFSGPNAANCYFRRWMGTTAMTFSSTAGLFPFKDVYGNDQSLTLAGTLTTGGWYEVNYKLPQEGPFSIGSFADAGVTITQALYGVYATKSGGGFTGSGMSLQLKSGGLNVVDPTHTRVANAYPSYGAAPGSHLSATGSGNNVVVSRTNLNQATLSDKGFMIAFPTADISASPTSVQNGNWNNPSTWNCNCVPANYSDVEYHHNITVNSLPAGKKQVLSLTHFGSAADKFSVQSDTLSFNYFHDFATAYDTIEIAGGVMNLIQQTYAGISYDFTPQVLNMKSGQLNVGAERIDDYHTTRNSMFSPECYIQSGGRIYVNGGYFAHDTDRAFVTGGSLFINPSQQAPVYSYTNYPIYIQAGGVTRPKSYNGASIYLINPITHFVFANDLSVRIENNLTAATGALSLAGSSLYLGYDTSIADYMSNFNGFFISAHGGSVTVPWGNIIAQGGTYSKRHTIMSGTAADTVYGDITVPANCQFYMQSGGIWTKGNIINNGAFTMDANTALIPIGTQSQMISGTGRFTSDPSLFIVSALEPYIANVYNMNSAVAPGGLTINLSGRNLNVNEFDSYAGDTYIADTLTIGQSTSNVGFLGTNGTGAIMGKLRKWVNTTNSAYVFSVGVASQQRQLNVFFNTAPTSGGTLMTEYVPGVSGSNGLPLTQGTILIDHTGTNGFWRVTAANGLSGGSYTVSMLARNYSNIVDYTKLVALKRPNASSPWTLQGTHIATTGSNTLPLLSRSGLTSFSEFAVGSNTVNPLALHLLSFTGNYNNGTVPLQWNVTDEQDMSSYGIERSADGVAFQAVGKVMSKGDGNNSYSFVDVMPMSGANYYRLAMKANDGSVSYSNTILIQNKVAENVKIYPNPAHQTLSLVGFNGMIELTDMNGKICMSIHADGTAELDVSKLPRGNYILRYQQGDDWGAKEIVLR